MIESSCTVLRWTQFLSVASSSESYNVLLGIGWVITLINLRKKSFEIGKVERRKK